MLAMDGRPEHVVAAFEAGADDYIVRPFSPAQLRAKTHTWLLRAGSPGHRDAGRTGDVRPTGETRTAGDSRRSGDVAAG
jgi:DNA-binding response OmpR family regulator